MKTKILYFALVLNLLPLFADAKGDGELVGKWTLIDGLPCKYAEYNYFSDGRFTVRFNENNLSGKYEVSKGTGRKKITWHFSADDKKPNCSGKDWQLVGHSLSIYFEIKEGAPEKIYYFPAEDSVMPNSIFGKFQENK